MLTPKCYPVIFLIVLVTASCSLKEDARSLQDLSEVPRVELGSLKLFLSPETSNMNRPGYIETLPEDKLAVLDTDQLSVFIYNHNGELETGFGRRGKGPGEFVAPRGLQINASTINVIDVALQRINRFNPDGSFIQIYNIEKESSFFGFVATGDSLDYYTVANGREGKLVGHHIANTDSTRYFGNAVVENPPPPNDKEAFLSSIAEGEVPDAVANDLIMDYSDGSLYVYVNAQSCLQKYTDGNLVWDRKIALPVNKIIFENFLESVRKSSSSFGVLRYVNDITVTSNHIYLLWNGASENPQQIVQVNSKGIVKSIYRLPHGQKTSYSSIAVDENSNRLYLASPFAAEIHATLLSSI